LNFLCNNKALLEYIERPALGWEPKRKEKSKSMEIFEIAEKEYLDFIGPKEPEPMEFPNGHFCSEGRKHRFVE
jgi:hypothetical protein